VPGALHIEMVGVGHGDCFILQWVPEKGLRSTIVIDGGPSGGGMKLDLALSSMTATQVDLMVLSHTDADHVDGLLEYARRDARLPIRRYWGPCLPAFERHRWLFPDRVRRGLDVASTLEREIAENTVISWPVEHASWQSDDGGLRVRVLSPAGRLIERLLLAKDSSALFLQQPMPVGWLLLDAPADPGPEDAWADLRVAILSGEIDPGRIPPDLPPLIGLADREALTAEAARDFGIAPEYFGNSVLNDTSLVLLVEAELGGTTKRLLFTGDLQTFTYLMAKYPTGLGLELVKAPHHGSRSHVGEKLEAYDEVWQWLRPRAVLVSAGGKHSLPRSDFRNAALRSGAALFCACRRGKEILLGAQTESCCHTQFACSRAVHNVRIDITRESMVADAQACSNAAATGVAPVIQMVQHLVDPSAILDRLTTAERDKHVGWIARLLRDRHRDRVRAGGEAKLEPIAFRDLEREASAAGRFRAAASMDIIVDAGARAGAIWASRPGRWSHADRHAWIMPDKVDLDKIWNWLSSHSAIFLAIKNRTAGQSPRELLLAGDTGFLAHRTAILFGFPVAMFDDAIWPRLVTKLVESRWQVFNREIDESGITAVLCAPTDLSNTFRALADRVGDSVAASYLREIARNHHPYDGDNTAKMPDRLNDIIAPYWLGDHSIFPRDFGTALTWTGSEAHCRLFGNPGLVTEEERLRLHRYKEYYKLDGQEQGGARLLAALLVGGF